MSFPLPNGTRVRLLDSEPNRELAEKTGFNPTGMTGTIMKNFLYYHVAVDGVKAIPSLPDNVLCLLPDEIEVIDGDADS